MSAVNDEPRPDWCACVVVSVGRAAHQALRDVPLDAPRFWYAIAVGPDAALAQADRTLAIDADENGFDSVLARLAGTWTGIEFVYVVFDQHDDDARQLACAILGRAHDVSRTCVAVLLGRSSSCHREPTRDVCDAALRLADEHAPASIADALYGLLSPFIPLWAPVPLDELAMTLREASDARVVARRYSSSTFEMAVASLVGETLGAPYFIHMLHAAHDCTLRDGGGPERSGRLANTRFSVGTGQDIVPDDVLTTIVAPLGAPMSARAGRQLCTIVADRAADVLWRSSDRTMYRQRLVKELAWWTARDDRADQLLQLTSVISEIKQRGGAVGPALRNAGGSLVAYVLGLSAFDPVEWNLSFEELVNGRDQIVLEASVSQRAFDLHRRGGRIKDVAPLEENDDWSLVVDPRLDAFDLHGPRSPDWPAALWLMKRIVAAPRSPVTTSTEQWIADLATTRDGSAIARDLVYDDQITGMLSALLKVSYPHADRLRRVLARRDASADEAAAECSKWSCVALDRSLAVAAIDVIRHRAMTSTSRSVALSDAVMLLASST